MSLERFLPENLHRRVAYLTKSKNYMEAIERLCESGYVELAHIVLTSVATLGERSAFTPTPLSDKLVKCFTSYGGNIAYVLFTVERESSEDTACVAIDNYTVDTSYFVRPCTVSELDLLVEREGLKKEKGRKKVSVHEPIVTSQKTKGE